MLNALIKRLGNNSYLNLTDFRYIVQGSFWLSFSQGVNAISGFFLSLIYARYIPKEVFGEYVYVFAFINFFGSLVYPGLFNALVRAVAQKREAIIRQAPLKSLPWAVVSAIPLLGVSFYYGFIQPQHSELARVFFITSILVIPIWILRFYDTYYYGKTKYKDLFVLQTISTVLNLAFTFLVSLYVPFTAPLVLSSLGLNLILNVLFTVITNRKANTNEPVKEDFSYALKLTDVTIFTNVAGFADKFVVAHFLGFESVAIYTFAQVIPEQIKSFMKNFYTLYLPKLSSQADKLDLSKFHTRLAQFFMFSIGAVIVFNLLINPLFALLFPAYTQAILPARILSLSLISVPSMLIQAYFEANAAVISLRWKTYIPYVMQVILIVLLTPLYGIIGTISAITITRVFSLFLSLYLLYIYESKLVLKQVLTKD